MRGRETEKFLSCGERQTYGGEGGEEPLMWKASLPSGARVTSGQGLLLRAVSGYVCGPTTARAVLISKVPVAIKDLVGAQGLKPHLELCWCLGATP